ncbi:DUF5956 family protein [Arthrobacter sp. GCM10027362]|uniref:DUF5956 family protein n=1 Tax=Arthrobacter sp. GCM10027362 TaxID=3273379 RepID=UPI0036266139
MRTEMVRISCRKPDGTITSWEEPMTEDDVRGIEDDIDMYLKAARKARPPPPHHPNR